MSMCFSGLIILIYGSRDESELVANQFGMNLWLHLNEGLFTQESTQVTQSRRGYMQESSGSALVMFLSAVSQRCNFC
jgi:hypothetical protein